MSFPRDSTFRKVCIEISRLVVDMFSAFSVISNRKFSMMGRTDLLGIAPKIRFNCFKIAEEETIKFMFLIPLGFKIWPGPVSFSGGMPSDETFLRNLRDTGLQRRFSPDRDQSPENAGYLQK
jgi:hypothetical protein